MTKKHAASLQCSPHGSHLDVLRQGCWFDLPTSPPTPVRRWQVVERAYLDQSPMKTTLLIITLKRQQMTTETQNNCKDTQNDHKEAQNNYKETSNDHRNAKQLQEIQNEHRAKQQQRHRWIDAKLLLLHNITITIKKAGCGLVGAAGRPVTKGSVVWILTPLTEP